MPDQRDHFFATSVNDRRCAQCWKPMVLKWANGEWQIVCPRGCQPGGHVSAGYVDYRERHDALDAETVGANYPELDEHKLSAEDVEANKKALWG